MVSLTCMTTKLMEHIIFHSITAHLESHNLLQHHQHGFRQQHSTESQLIITVEETSKALDNHHQIDMLIFDFSKAFDTVPHQRLLGKIDHYGIRDHTKNWIKTWLTTRSQRVVVDGEASETIHVDSGAPQGTVLGPLMFLLYINDIGENISSSIKLFADDCLLFRNIDSTEDTKALQEDLTRLGNWTEKWQMLFNAKKCYTMRIHRKKQPIIHNYTMGDEVLSACCLKPALLRNGDSRKAQLETSHQSSCSKSQQNTWIYQTKPQFMLFFHQKASLHNSCQVTTGIRGSYMGSIPAKSNWQPWEDSEEGIRFIAGNYSREDSVTAMRMDIGLPTFHGDCSHALPWCIRSFTSI